MALAQFENIINGIRSILRNEGITGMDSIHHCVAFTLMRFLTNNACVKFDIPVKFAYDNFLTDEATGQRYVDGDPRIIPKFYTTNDSIAREDILYAHFIDVFGYKFDFKIKSSYNFVAIFKTMANVNLNELAQYCDIIGMIYELHLKSGSSNSMRDLGQYFTHRGVIKYMVSLCNPTIKEDGTIEKVLDPSMGSGGFLAMAAKHINSTCEGLDWSVDKLSFFGFDIDENVKNLAMLNLLLETGEMFDTTLMHMDSLQNDYRLADGTIMQKVDVILANEPFGIKSLIYANCCQRIKQLKINGTKAEPLFLQLMMQSLNEGGRCAVIVPDGVLFNDAKLHSDTRKYLIENLNLRKVVKLGEKTFLNTGVNSSILFFSNDGRTRSVSYDVIKLNGGDVVEEHIIDVPYEQIINNKYDLNIGKYMKVEETRTEGIEYKKLGDICTFLPTTKHTSSNGKQEGKYRFYNSSQDDKLYSDTCEVVEPSIIIGNGGNLCVHFDEKFTPSKHVTVIQLNQNNQHINLMYIYYFLIQNRQILHDLSAGTTIKWLNKTNLGTIKIPIPSIEIQQKIIKRCDSLTQMINNLKSNNITCEEEKQAYLKMIVKNYDRQKLENILTVKQGDYITKSTITPGQYYVYGGGDASYTIDRFNNENRLIIAKDGVSENCVRWIKDKFFLNHHGWTVTLENANIHEKYVYYYLHANQNILYNLANGSAQKGINQKNFYDLTIIIPPLEIQEQIIKICDQYDKFIENNKMYIKFFEEQQNNTISLALSQIDTADNDVNYTIVEGQINDISTHNVPLDVPAKKTTKKRAAVIEI
jgi:type I restriction-modification system DNA methylase subunit/restriction endonuclease S subunit